MSAYVQAVSRIHRIILSPPSNLANVESLIRTRANQLQHYLQQDTDAVLASLYLQQHGQDLRAHKHVLGAAVCGLLAERESLRRKPGGRDGLVRRHGQGRNQPLLFRCRILHS